MCNDCMARVPYATLIATIMCSLGVGVFCGTMYRGATLVVLMMDQVFHLRITWFEAVQMGFAIIGASMAALGFMILCVGCLATGATRTKVYRAWRTRVGGRISCAVVSTPALLPAAALAATATRKGPVLFSSHARLENSRKLRRDCVQIRLNAVQTQIERFVESVCTLANKFLGKIFEFSCWRNRTFLNYFPCPTLWSGKAVL